MSIWLQLVLAIVLLVLCGFLVPLLMQLRRTATSVQHLAESAQADLHQIAQDVHHLRERADGLADLAQAGLEGPVDLSRFAASTAKSVLGLVAREGLPWLGALLTGIKVAMRFFRRPRKEAAP